MVAKAESVAFSEKAAFFALKWLLFILLCCVVSNLVNRLRVGAVTLWQEKKVFLIERFTRVKVVERAIQSDNRSIPELVPVVAKEQKVPAIAFKALVMQESTLGVDVYRFEPEKYNELKLKYKTSISDDEIRALASSHGPAHVMGFNAEAECGIHWSKLYDPYTGLTCGAKIFRKQLERFKSEANTAERVRLAFKGYNGTGARAEEHASRCMAWLGKFLYQTIKEEL